MIDKDILKFVQNSKNIIDVDSDDENELNNSIPHIIRNEKRRIRAKEQNTDTPLGRPRSSTWVRKRLSGFLRCSVQLLEDNTETALGDGNAKLLVGSA
ncbi:hypothetical protein TNCV_1715591 [Trichonephila clavipes]|nr:hypothetical protein TNCV_1715591 [Trichonephila clavipes]